MWCAGDKPAQGGCALSAPLSPDEIDITEEMIAAGAVVISGALVDLISGYIGPSRVAKLVYLEMRKTCCDTQSNSS